MPAYHSKIDGAGADEACGCALLPLKTKLRGPAGNYTAMHKCSELRLSGLFTESNAR